MHLVARRALAGVLLGIASTAAWAQGYPDRPLRLVVGFPPGGSGDFLARIIADELTREIGQPVVVDNKPGAGSNIAAEHVARAAPDGYTILLAGNFTHAINPWLYKNLSWDPHRDFTPITEVALMSIIVCVTPERGIRSMKELVGHLGAARYSARGEGAPIRIHHAGHAPAAGCGEARARGDGACNLRLARGIRRVRAQGPRFLRAHRQGFGR